MIQLFLDGMPAIPAANANIKLTSENPLYSDTTSYTYDVELPLDLPENRGIFGPIQRLEYPKSEREFDARLLADNVLLLTGKAHITSVTDKAVKVQLLGGSAAYNYRNKLDGLYIDELDLGSWETDAWELTEWRPGTPVTPSRGDGDTSRPPAAGKNGITDTTDRIVNIISRDKNGVSSDIAFTKNIAKATKWVNFPVMNLTAGFRCNKVGWLFDTESKTETGVLRGRLWWENEKQPGMVAPSIAIQPFLWVMAEKIAAATGTLLPRENNVLFTDNEFLGRIFIVNANNFLDCRMCLPHWTVNEWWSKLEDAFGVVVSFDLGSGAMSICKRAERWSAADMVVVDNVVDEYSVDLDDESVKDISASNVGFSDFDGDNAALLTDTQRQAARINDSFANLEELLAYGKSIGENGMRLQKDVLFYCADGRRYIFTEACGFMEVDQFRPRIVDEEKDVDLNLDFVPARYVEDKAEVYYEYSNHGTRPWCEVLASIKVKVLAVPDIPEMKWYLGGRAAPERIDLEQLISNEEDPEVVEKSNGRSLCYIALAPSDGTNFEVIKGTKIHYLLTDYSLDSLFHPAGALCIYGTANLGDEKPIDRYLSDAMPTSPPYMVSLSLNPIEGVRTLASSTVSGEGLPKIKATVRHCFRFISDRMPDPTSLFLIRNRRFVCDKIEATITADGLQPLLTGYFYELDT